MKNTAFSLLALFALLLSVHSGKAQNQAGKSVNLSADKRILIVYLSRTNNTKAIAEMIQKQVGGKLVALELQTPYPANYQQTVQQVADENEKGYLPPLKTKIEGMETYDVVFVGFPTWGMQLPPPMKSFLSQHNLKGKTIIPFNTNAGYGEGSSFETVKNLCKNSKVPEGFVTRGGIEKEGKLLVIKGIEAISADKHVRKWLQKIGMLSLK